MFGGKPAHWYAVRLRIFDRFAKDPPTDPKQYIALKRLNQRNDAEEKEFNNLNKLGKKDPKKELGKKYPRWEELKKLNTRTEKQEKQVLEYWDFVKKLQNTGKGNGQKGYGWPKTAPPPLSATMKLSGLKPGGGTDPGEDSEVGEELNRSNFGRYC
jgi:hypothetical protein